MGNRLRLAREILCHNPTRNPKDHHLSLSNTKFMEVCETQYLSAFQGSPSYTLMGRDCTFQACFFGLSDTSP